MKVSTRGRYGLRAMIEIARRQTDKPVLGRDIACAQKIPLDYLEQIFVKLRRARLIKTARGVGGGYFLSRPPEQINALEIVEAAEGSLLPVECLRRKGVCERAGSCVANELWLSSAEAMRGVLKETNLAQLRDRQEALTK